MNVMKCLAPAGFVSVYMEWNGHKSYVGSKIVICYEHREVYTCRNEKTSIGSCSIDNEVDNVFVKCFWLSIDGLLHDCSNSITNALELQQPCIKPSQWFRTALCGPDDLIQNLVYGPVLTDDVIQNLVAFRLLNKGIEM